ncbi:MAG: hypothetical protein A2138_14365 [Deltaproteobacteria bacterium RBG_16_71_12]|nr:MAG: hypothetical protein A2138_14365 [Deltaproteobacteria bacterium RBG_16_71_12]
MMLSPPLMSSKNQPQDVYIKSAQRCISSSRKNATRSSADSFFLARSATSSSARAGSSTTSM